jgi:S-adenosylmethionine synthetase
MVKVYYEIGVEEKIEIKMFDYGKYEKKKKELMKIVEKKFDIRNGKIVKEINMSKNI